MILAISKVRVLSSNTDCGRGPQRLPKLASELVGLKVDFIVTSQTPSVQAIQKSSVNNTHRLHWCISHSDRKRDRRELRSSGQERHGDDRAVPRN